MHRRLHAFFPLALAALCGTAFAQATITHDKALAGGVTPGDIVGYPVWITQPGHFKLMGNLVVPAGFKGIEIRADNVTLDLNGFSVIGPVTCAGTVGSQQMCSADDQQMHGIEVKASNATIRNGSVVGFAGDGIAVGGSLAVISDVTVRYNAKTGLSIGSVGEHHARVTRVMADRNGDSGITAAHSVISDCVASNNYLFGIRATQSSLLSNSIASGNRVGLMVTSGTVFRDNNLANNSNGATASSNAFSAGGNFNGTSLF
jgi:hypothetical protein